MPCVCQQTKLGRERRIVCAVDVIVNHRGYCIMINAAQRTVYELLRGKFREQLTSHLVAVHWF